MFPSQYTPTRFAALAFVATGRPPRRRLPRLTLRCSSSIDDLDSLIRDRFYRVWFESGGLPTAIRTAPAATGSIRILQTPSCRRFSVAFPVCSVIGKYGHDAKSRLPANRQSGNNGLPESEADRAAGELRVFSSDSGLAADSLHRRSSIFADPGTGVCYSA